MTYKTVPRDKDAFYLRTEGIFEGSRRVGGVGRARAKSREPSSVSEDAIERAWPPISSRLANSAAIDGMLGGVRDAMALREPRLRAHSAVAHTRHQRLDARRELGAIRPVKLGQLGRALEAHAPLVPLVGAGGAAPVPRRARDRARLRDGRPRGSVARRDAIPAL